MYEVKHVNQPIDIQAPEDCGGAAEDIPMMADAADQSSFGGMSTYTTPSKFEDVVTFYEKEMKAKGWQAKEDGGMSAEGVSMKSYTKDGRTVQVMITADSQRQDLGDDHRREEVARHENLRGLTHSALLRGASQRPRRFFCEQQHPADHRH